MAKWRLLAARNFGVRAREIRVPDEVAWRSAIWPGTRDRLRKWLLLTPSRRRRRRGGRSRRFCFSGRKGPFPVDRAGEDRLSCCEHYGLRPCRAGAVGPDRDERDNLLPRMAVFVF